jgi:hypothetical protein
MIVTQRAWHILDASASADSCSNGSILSRRRQVEEGSFWQSQKLKMKTARALGCLLMWLQLHWDWLLSFHPATQNAYARSAQKPATTERWQVMSTLLTLERRVWEFSAQCLWYSVEASYSKLTAAPSTVFHAASRTSEFLNLGVCILLRVLDQVQGFPPNATVFNSCLLFHSNYPLHSSVVRPSSCGNMYIHWKLTWLTKLACLHPVAYIRSGSGVSV